MTTTLSDCANEAHVAAAMLYRPELLNGCRDLVAPPLFHEPVFRDIATLCLLNNGARADVEAKLYASGKYADRLLDDELRGLSVLADLLDTSKVREAVERMTRDDVVTRQLGELPTTDLGNAQRLTTRHGRELRYIQPWRRWLVWDGRRWSQDQNGEVQRRAKHTVRRIYAEADASEDPERRAALAKWAGQCEAERKIAAMISLAWSEPGIPVLPDDLDADPWLLNVANGTIDLRTGALRDHDPADLITKLAPVDYDPDATCPVFDRFLTETTCGSDPLATYIQQVSGIGLTGDISEQVFLVYCGGGSNGKSTLIDVQLDIMGDYAGIAPPDLLTLKTFKPHPTEIVDLMGRRLVVAGETERGDRLRVQLVKQLTGDARLKGRGMRQDFVTFRRTFLTLLVTNNRPRIDETTHAVWRRVRLVPFMNKVEGADQDRDLGKKLKTEHPGILAWMVRGCLSWRADGLQTPVEVTGATDEYEARSNWLKQFTEECLHLNPIMQTTSASLATVLRDWCVDTGLDGDMPSLRDWLSEHGCTPTRTKALGRCWKGVALVQPDEGEAA